MTATDLVTAVEVAKAGAPEQTFQLDYALSKVATVRTLAGGEWGPVVCGHSVNQPLSDLYRELDEAERALRNAMNAVRVLDQARIGALA